MSSRSATRAGIAAIVLGALFVLLAVAVAAGWSAPGAIDLAVEPAVHTWMGARAGAVSTMLVVTDLGSPVAMDILTALAAAGLWWRRHRREAVAVVLVRVVALGIETAAKAAVSRPRPVLPMPFTTAGSSSFPSGHSAGTAAVVGFLGILLAAAPGLAVRIRALGVLVLGVFVLAVPASRVALGVHYPSDVLAGTALGLATAAAAHAVLIRTAHRQRP